MECCELVNRRCVFRHKWNISLTGYVCAAASEMASASQQREREGERWWCGVWDVFGTALQWARSTWYILSHQQSINLMELSSFIKTNLIEKHYWFDSIIVDVVYARKRKEKNEKRKIYDWWKGWVWAIVLCLCAPEMSWNWLSYENIARAQKKSDLITRPITILLLSQNRIRVKSRHAELDILHFHEGFRFYYTKLVKISNDDANNNKEKVYQLGRKKVP